MCACVYTIVSVWVLYICLYVCMFMFVCMVCVFIFVSMGVCLYLSVCASVVPFLFWEAMSFNWP